MQASNLAHKNTIASLKRSNGVKPNEEDADIKDAGNSFSGKYRKTRTKFWIFGQLEVSIIITYYSILFYYYFKSRPVIFDKNNVSEFISNNRRNISSSTVHNKNSANSRIMYRRTELDSHADSIVAGSNCCIMHYTNRECGMSPYRDD